MKIKAVTICESHRLTLLKHWLDFFSERVDYLHVFIQKDRADIDSSEAIRLVNSYPKAWAPLSFPWPHDCNREQKEFIRFMRTIDVEGWHWCSDSDEFPDENLDLRDVANKLEAGNYTHAKFRMIDRLAPSGQLTEMTEAPSLFRQYPVQSSVTAQLARGYDIKVPFCKDPYHGHHHFYGRGKGSRRLLRLNHFKWDSTVEERMVKRYQQNIETGNPYAHERSNIYEHIREHGRIAVELFEPNLNNLLDLK